MFSATTPSLAARPRAMVVGKVSFVREITSGCAVIQEQCTVRWGTGSRAYFTTRSQTNVLSTTGWLSSEASTRNDIRSVPWKVYHLLVALPTALGV
jgi:hypothetical protein